ncbi:MAG: PAS domain S-box protein [Acidobacteriota bacterium]
MPVKSQGANDLVQTLEDQSLRDQRERALEALEAFAQRHRQLFERNVAGVYRATLDGRLLECNEACARIFGFSSAEELLRCRTVDFYVDPADRDRFIRQILQTRTLTNFEVRLRRKDGSPLWILENVTLVEDALGDPTLLEGTLVDITELKQAEAKARRLNRLHAVLSQLNQAVVRTEDRDRLLQEVCRIAVEQGLFRMAWFGLLDEQTGRVAPVAHAGVEDGYLDNIRISVNDEPEGWGPTGRALRQGRAFICNDIEREPCMLPWRAEAVRRGYRSSASFPIRLEDRVIGAFNLYAAEPGFFDEENADLLEEVAADVSFAVESMERNLQRQRAEAALRESEERYRRMVETAAEGIWIIDADHRTTFVNPAMAAMLGYTVEEMTGQPVFAFLDEEAAAQARENLPPRSQGTHSDMDVRLKRRDGADLWAIVRTTPLSDSQGRYAGLLGMFTDITERKRTEEERAQLLARAEAARAQVKAEARFRELMEAAPDAIFQIDRQGRIVLLNKAAERIFGYQREELLGKSVETLIPVRYRERHAGFRTGCLSYPLLRTMDTVADPRARRKDGSEISVDIDLSPVETEEGALFTCIIRDVTERKLLEDQLRQSQKMEALGRLAGGVAHDFNNLLTIIGGYGQMVLDSLRPKDPLRKDMEPIMEAAYRATTLSRQLLTFSRHQVFQPKVLDLNRVVSRMNKMLRRVIGEDIELSVALKPGLRRVRTDPGQLGQVIMNLVVNARDAMPAGGKLTITTEELELGKERPGPPNVNPGRYVLLTVSDTGTGMDAQTRSRIFEPFFTTKEKGKGTGLGLSTVYGIVKQSGGEIRVESEPGQGATFQIYFPVAREGSKPRELRTALRGPQRGTETILLAEDEQEVRDMASDMLRRQGYTVLTADDGAEALEIWDRQQESIQMLVTDVIMPRVGGRELAERLRQSRPNLPVLYISGYTDEVIARHGILDSDAGFLQKPFTQAELGRKVRAALDTAAGR